MWISEIDSQAVGVMALINYIIISLLFSFFLEGDEHLRQINQSHILIFPRPGPTQKVSLFLNTLEYQGDKIR